jgi:sporulation protein YlmC with PRC-barrel domain
MELSGDPWAISELIGKPVRDHAGHELGRVFEVRAHWERGAIVFDELMVGRRALWQRLRGPAEDAHGLPWASVVDVGRERIVVHP